MKKILFSCVLATVSVLTCGAQDMKNWEGEFFSISYPVVCSVEKNGYVDESMAGMLFGASQADGEIKVNATYNAGGPTVGQLGEYANNLHFMHSGSFSDWACDEPVVKGNKLTMRKVSKDDPEYPDKDKFVEWDFAVIGSGTKGVAGTVRFPLDKEKEYTPYVNAVVNSVKIK